MTNFEKLKNMNIEDFTVWLSNLVDCSNCTIRGIVLLEGVSGYVVMRGLNGLKVRQKMIDFKNYERVTKKDEWGTALKDVDMGDLYSNLSKIEQITIEYALDRLAELEDKIENGTLVSVPYSIGQELYCVYNKSYKIERVKVSLITIRHDGSIDIRLNHYYEDGSYCGCFKYDSKYYELFKTETEALEKLNEVKQKI